MFAESHEVEGKTKSLLRPRAIPATTDVLIIGAGPVGLLLAHALGIQNVRTLIVEQRVHPPKLSMAIGITPSSLAILEELNLGQEFLSRGVKIERAWVHENNDCLGILEFGRVTSRYPFILSLPQGETIQILQDGLGRHPSVTFCRGVEWVAQQSNAEGVTARLREGGEELGVEAKWVVACDGHRSELREAANITLRGHLYPIRFAMADVKDQTAWRAEARVFFGTDGAVESFPLPRGKRRWIVQLPGAVAAVQPEQMIGWIRRRTGIDLSSTRWEAITVFHPKRGEARQFFSGRTILCGDAAHVMSPIGGQGMNTGFADAFSLAEILVDGMKEPIAKRLEQWQQERRGAFRFAASGAAAGMWLGTRSGVFGSRFRRLIIGRVLFHPWLKPRLAEWFTSAAGRGRRVEDLEEMDRPECSTEKLLRTVDQFTSINRQFSRYRTIFDRWIFPTMAGAAGRPLHLVDLGAGGCDIVVWALQQAKRRGMALRVTAVDSEPRTVEHAMRRYGGYPGLTIRCMDAKQIAELDEIDFIFANHFLHHFRDADAVSMLKLIGRTVKLGAVVSDLKRSLLSRIGYSLAATPIYRRSFAVADGLLSIRRGFSASDLLRLAKKAGLQDRAEVKQLVPGRLVLRIRGGQAAY